MRIRGLTIEWTSIRITFSVTPNVYGFLRNDAQMTLSVPLCPEKYISYVKIRKHFVWCKNVYNVESIPKGQFTTYVENGWQRATATVTTTFTVTST